MEVKVGIRWFEGCLRIGSRKVFEATVGESSLNASNECL